MKLKKVLALLLCAAMVLSTMGTVVFAEANELPAAVDGVITLVEDVTLSANTTIENVKIDLNNYTLSLNGVFTAKGNCEIYGGTIKAVENISLSDGLIRIGYYNDAAEYSLKISDATVDVKNVRLLTGVFCIGQKSEVELDNVTVNAICNIEDDVRGVFYCGSGLGGKVTLKNNSVINTEKVNAVFYRVAIDVADSEVICKDNFKPVFRGADGSIDNTKIEVTGVLKDGEDTNHALVQALDAQKLTFVNNTEVTVDDETSLVADGSSIEIIADNTSILPESDNVKMYVAKVNDVPYTDIKDAINNAQAGDTVTIFEGTYEVPAMKAGITVVGEGEVLLEGTLSGTLEDLTLKNLHIKGANAQRWAYAKGDLVFENVTFEATSVYALHFDGISNDATLYYKDCTIIGWAAMGGSPASCVFEGCTIKDNGKYGVIRTYFDTKIKDCTFDVDSANTEDVYQDGIHAVGATIKVEDCTNVNGDMKDILNISETAYIYVDDELVYGQVVDANGVVAPVVATVGNGCYTDIQEAIKAAAPAGTVDIIADVTVDTWIQFQQGNRTYPKLIYIDMNGLTINGNNHTLTVNSIESGSNGNQLFSGAENLNVSDLTIEVVNGAGGIGLESGIIKNVTFDGGTDGVYPGDGDVTITGCTFSTNGTAIYYEDARDNLKVTGNTFNQPAEKNVILIRGNTTFTDNTINSGRTVNVVSGSPVVSGNDFGDVRFKVYNSAEATIENNKINNLEFNDETPVNATFAGNILSDAARATLEGVGLVTVAKIGDAEYNSLQAAVDGAKAGDTITVVENINLNSTVTVAADDEITIDLNGKKISYTSDVDDADMLVNKGELTIVDNSKSKSIDGAMVFTYTGASNYRSTSTIVNAPGATLTIKAGIIENATAADNGSYAYGIDSQTNGGIGNVELNIEGGSVISNYMAIRQCVNGKTCTNTLNVSDGYIYGGKRAINVQDLSYTGNNDETKVNDMAVLSITDGTISAGENGYAVCVYAMTNNLSITDGAFDGMIFDYGKYYGLTDGFISGGIYNTDVSDWAAEKFDCIDVGAYDEYRYIVVDRTTSSKIEVILEKADEDVENVYNIKLVSADEFKINEFVAAEFTFENNSKTVGDKDMAYEVSGITENGVVKTVVEQAAKDEYDNEQYIIRIPSGEEANRLSGTEIVIGQVKFIGQATTQFQGNIDFKIASAEVDATRENTHLGKYYTFADGTLILGDDAKINNNISEIKRDVTVNVAFNHNIDTANYWNGYQITATLKNNFGYNVTKDIKIADIKSGAVTFENVPLGQISVTLEAPGFRTYTHKTVVEETADNGVLVLNFWNDAKRNDNEVIEAGKKDMAHNFLVGDIVMDYAVDKYDLAAVTSYYGTYKIAEADAEKYIKYDLNRDGDIDIRDVQYVLHTMGN